MPVTGRRYKSQHEARQNSIVYAASAPNVRSGTRRYSRPPRQAARPRSGWADSLNIVLSAKNVAAETIRFPCQPVPDPPASDHSGAIRDFAVFRQAGAGYPGFGLPALAQTPLPVADSVSDRGRFWPWCRLRMRGGKPSSRQRRKIPGQGRPAGRAGPMPQYRQ